MAGMNEAHMAEIERAMFVVSGARKRLERTAELLAKDEAEDISSTLSGRRNASSMRSA